MGFNQHRLCCITQFLFLIVMQQLGELVKHTKVENFSILISSNCAKKMLKTKQKRLNAGIHGSKVQNIKIS